MPSIREQQQEGFTLIEILVVLAILSVIFAIVFWSLSFQQITTSRQTAMTDIYENQRFALDTITRHVRMAAYNMNQPQFYLLGTSFLTPVIHHNNTIQNTDELIIRYNDDPDQCPDLTIKGCGGNNEQSCPSLGSAEIGIAGTIDPCWANKCHEGGGGQCDPPLLAMIIDPTGENASVFAMTTVQENADHVQHHSINSPTEIPGYGTYSGSNELCPGTSGNDCEYPPGSQIVMVSFTTISFRLDYDLDTVYPSYVPDPAHPRLVMIINPNSVNPDIIALGTDVEDLQFALALDENGNGVLDDQDADGEISEGDYVSTATAAQLASVRAVRVSMCVRSRDNVLKAGTGFRPHIEDHHPSDAQTDHYIRKTVSAKVKVRNLSSAFL